MGKTTGEAMDEFAYQKIWELIYNHRLIPGQKIVFRDLETLLKMSKTPILNALTRLKHDGIVVAVHNRGFYMKSWDAKDISQMFEVKTKVYDIAVDYVIRNSTAVQLERLKKAMNAYSRYKCNIYDIKKFKLDLDFHITLVKMGTNDYLTTLLEQQYGIQAYAMDLSLLTPYMTQFERDHIRIFHAIERGNAAEAKRLLRNHNKIGQKVVTTVK